MAIHTFSTLADSEEEQLIQQYKADCKKKGIVYSARFREMIVEQIKREQDGKDEANRTS